MFLFNFILNACRWVMQSVSHCHSPHHSLLHPCITPGQLHSFNCLTLGNIWVWYPPRPPVGSLGFHAELSHSTHHPCPGCTPSQLSGPDGCCLYPVPRLCFVFLYPYMAFPPGGFPKYCLVLAPTLVLLFSCVCTWEKWLAGNILLKVVVSQLRSRCGFASFQRTDRYTVGQVSISTVFLRENMSRVTNNWYPN